MYKPTLPFIAKFGKFHYLRQPEMNDVSDLVRLGHDFYEALKIIMDDITSSNDVDEMPTEYESFCFSARQAIERNHRRRDYPYDGRVYLAHKFAISGERSVPLTDDEHPDSLHVPRVNKRSGRQERYDAAYKELTRYWETLPA